MGVEAKFFGTESGVLSISKQHISGCSRHARYKGRQIGRERHYITFVPVSRFLEQLGKGDLTAMERERVRDRERERDI